MRIPTLFLSVAFAAALGCSSSSDGPTTSNDTGTSTDTATVGDTGTGGDTTTATDTATATDSPASDDADTSTAAKPHAPTIVSVAQMAGNLHVTWKLNDTGLTSVYVFRKKDAGTYEKAYTLPGSATSQHDTGASAPGTFCYQVQTVKDGVESDLSNEMCGTP
jgi:hypothetical protein